VRSVAWSSDGNTLASGSINTTINLWDVATGQVRAALNSSSSITGLAWSADGKTLISTELGVLKLWDLSTVA
jgi:WD40 repeat protein